MDIKKDVTFPHKGFVIVVIIAICVLIALLSLVAGYFAYRVMCNRASRMESTKAIGNKIIGALEAYHADNNEYPVSLDELVPRYLDKVERPTWGLRVWEYSLMHLNRQEYELAVGANRDYYPVLFYTSKGRRWYYDT